MRLLLFIAAAHCILENFQTVMDRINSVKRLTGSQSFYSYLGIAENASDSAVKKAYRRLSRAQPPAGISAIDYKNFLNVIHTTLTKTREDYDFILSNSRNIFGGNKENYRNHTWLLIFAAVVGVLFCDALFYVIRYLWYIEECKAVRHEHAHGISPAERKQRGPKRMPSAPQMYVLRTLMRMKSLIFR